MGNCCGGSAIVPSSSSPRPATALTPEAPPPSPPNHPPSTPSESLRSKGGPRMPAHGTTQNNLEMTTPEHPQRRGDDRAYPPSSSNSNSHSQETHPHLFRPRGAVSREKQERRSRFPSTLLSLLPKDFRCVVRCCAVSHNTNCCTIIHRFRTLVVGKVCIVYHTGRRRNLWCFIAARFRQVLTHRCHFQCGHVGMYPIIVAFFLYPLRCLQFVRGHQRMFPG